MSQRVRFQPGAIHHVGEILAQSGSKSVFLVTGRASYVRSGAAAPLAKILEGRQVVHFDDFELNPNLSDVERGLKLFRRHGFDQILAVGGGSVLDMVKLIGIFSAQDASPMELVCRERPIERAGPPVIAVPTTAGTGSEVTHFAAVYVDHEKHSVAHESMLPAHAVVDPELTESLPPKLTAIGGLDAFAQAVESMWSVHSTLESSGYARQAILLALEHLSAAVHRPSPEARRAMSMASHLAGKAINITKTTAPHAISYAMTSRFGVPHGHAVALTLAPILLYNSQVRENDAAQERGADVVRQTIADLNHILGCPGAETSCRKITEWIDSLGLPTRLSEVGILSPADRRLIAGSVNTERLANNPRVLTSEAIEEILARIA